MDIVYPLRPHDRNDELRYSLRSLANLAEIGIGTVWLVGYLPDWIDLSAPGIRYLSTAQNGTRYENSTLNMRTLCEHDEAPEKFIYFNDDFYVTRPMDRIPTLHRGNLRQHLATLGQARGPYQEGLADTFGLLVEVGVEDPLWYELHAPMVIDRAEMLRALDLAAMAGLRHPHKRTLHGNLVGVGGVQVEDCKLHEPTADPWEMRGYGFLSTATPAFRYGESGRWIRQLFPDPSPFERTRPHFAERRRAARARTL